MAALVEHALLDHVVRPQHSRDYAPTLTSRTELGDMGTKPKRATKAAWYGVKTIFRIEAVGKAIARDSAYDSSVSLVEERIVLFKAHGFGAAIRAAEKEARQYTRRRYVNPYGQRVITRYLGACDAFEFFESPGTHAEVFSATEVVPKRVPDRSVIDQRLGRRVAKKADRARRRNILNREFEGGVRLNGRGHR